MPQRLCKKKANNTKRIILHMEEEIMTAFRVPVIVMFFDCDLVSLGWLR